jgi:hypothetical protein
LDLAYIAGYTDAEGCIAVWGGAPRKPFFANVSFRQSRREVVDLINNLYPASISFEYVDGKKPIIVYRLQALEAVRAFLTDVLPYLREKRPQAELLLREFDPRDRDKANAVKLALQHLKKVPLTPPDFSTLKHSIEKAVKTCAWDGCVAKSAARGFCKNHYPSARAQGKITVTKRGDGQPFVYNKQPTPEMVAYFAGYFDGDGCLKLGQNKNKKWELRVTFNQTQVPAVTDMQQVYGGSLRPIVMSGRAGLHYQLCQRNAVLAFLRDIAGICLEKRDQVEACLKECDPGMSEETASVLREKLRVMKRVVLPEESNC